MIGGGYAVNFYTHARYPTKDLDIFTTAAEFPRLLSHLQRNNRVSADESWLGKVHRVAQRLREYVLGNLAGATGVQVSVRKPMHECEKMGFDP